MPKTIAKKPRKAVHDVEGSVDEIMQTIDDHDFSSSKVPQSVSIEFWKSIMSQLRTRIKALKPDEPV
jgi:hypothetical protein